MVTHEHELVRSFQRRVIVIQNGQVVSDTPDPTFAKFKTKEQEKVTDMFYYEEDVKQENVSEVFDNLGDIVSGEDKPEEAASETDAKEETGGEEV
jgi:ABC-type methionine transport system ATPase subunit